MNTPYDKIRFEYDITAHCNLNCAGCSHYSPIAKEEFVTAKKADKELRRLGELIANKCDIIHIMGGEPLLNPEICEILKILREAFPDTCLQIVTNGILLADMPPLFWKTCHDLRVSIYITAYPIKLSVSKIEAYAKAFNVKINIFRNGNAFSRYPLSKAGNENTDGAFEICPIKHCQQFHDGKLYICSITGCVYKLNAAFNENFEITKDDYIDIYDNITVEDIFAFLKKPVPFCRYCNAELWKKHEYKYTWCQSKKDPEEWILREE